MHRFFATLILLGLSAQVSASPLVVGYERLLEKDGQPTAMQGRVLMKALHCAQCHDEGEKKWVASKVSQSLFQNTEKKQGTPEQITKGEDLFHTVGCVACHAPQRGPQNNVHAEVDDPFGDLNNPVVEVVVPNIPSIPLYKTALSSHAKIQHVLFHEVDLNALTVYLQTLDHSVEATDAPLNNLDKKQAPNVLKDHNAGCLATTRLPGIPWYNLNSQQRKAIQLALAESEAPDTRTEILETLAELNCFACHERDGYGGIEEGRRPYFVEDFDAELGDEGRIPPTLTGVGAKLTAKGLHEIMVERKTVRPYMATRMPQFDETRMETLAKQFKEVDKLVTNVKIDVTGLLHHHRNQYGRQLMGSDGLSCISCHGLQGEKSLGIPAIDLAHTTDRLEPEWFMAYMLDPPSLRPGTRMPSFFEGNKSTFTKLFGGNAVQQVEALWIYLRELDQTRLPIGMEGDEDYTLVPTDRPIVLRTFMKDVSTHAIAVGYPEGINIAFDALNVRLAIAWKGAFIDAESTWANRFSPFAVPLGEDVHTFEGGLPFIEGDKARYRFKGYTLDEQGIPTFLYTLTLDIITVPVTEKIFVQNNQLVRQVVLPNGMPGSAGESFEQEYMHTW